MITLIYEYDMYMSGEVQWLENSYTRERAQKRKAPML